MEEKKKKNFENKVKKLLIGFFVGMFLLTLISKAADSLTIGKVTVTQTEMGELTFVVNGTGTVKSHMEKNIRPPSGYVIDKIDVKEGQAIDNGDVLFYYNMESIKEQMDLKEKELKKLQLEYERTQLAIQSGENGVMAKEQALLQVENAKKDLKKIIEEKEKIEKTVKENKEEELKQAEKEKETLIQQKNKGLKEEKRKLEDEGNTLKKQEQIKKNLEDIIKAYERYSISKDYLGVSGERDALIKVYYGNSYTEKKKEIEKVSKNVSRAKSDLEDIVNKWKETIDESDEYSPDEGVQEAYKQQIRERNSQIKQANRDIADLQDTLSDLLREENEIDDLLSAFQRSLLGSETEKETAYIRLFDKIWNKANTTGMTEKEADTINKRAEEDYQYLLEEWKDKETEALDKVKEIRKVLEEINKGDYDFSKDTEEWNRKKEQAERTLELAELNLQQIQENEDLGREADNKAKKTSVLTLEGIQMDIDEKEKQVSELDEIIKSKGAVKSSVSGSVSSIGFEEGSVLSGQEKISIAISGYGLEAKLHKEQMEEFEVGDEITISNKEGMTSNAYNEGSSLNIVIESMSVPDEEDQVTIIALLPEGEYKVNQSLNFRISKTSDVYSQCVPVQALRQDANGVYVLSVIEIEGILGKESIASRVGVEVIKRDSQKAAISSSLLTGMEMIISGSSKNIAKGDRVRIEQ